MTTRQQLLDAHSRLMPRVRLDSDLTDRAIALQILSALKFDVDAITPSGARVCDRPDAFITTLAIGLAERSDEERAALVDNDRAHARSRANAQKRRDIGVKTWQQPLPNDRRRK